MSVKILLDECLPKKLKYRIAELDPEFTVTTVPEMGWTSAADGVLLKKAQKDFGIFLTSDRNLSFQQHIEHSDLHVILLKASTNTYEDLLSLVKKLKPVIEGYKPGKFSEVE